ncbi:MAG: type II toxin-antitoxin system RelE/ParE family toxin [Lachnospiraceae bacterium]|jgi:plasmid stabilization system protein ParE|nr:type II toxin-antitoxin system RelE/ParE family toxin [Lachnospiraceae bacterium]
MASKGCSYYLTETAEADVDEAFAYISIDLSNPEAASDFADELEGKLEELCKAPRTGRPVENDYLKRSDVRRILVGNYVAYYLVDEEKKAIIVLRVVYGKHQGVPGG